MIAKCDKAAECLFFKKYSTAQGVGEDFKKYLNDYCNGENYGQCKIRMVIEQLGGKLTPHNMMPDGKPLPGSDEKFWSEGVKLIVG
ncbi:MAG: hypothetical protein ACQESF_05280 [Nanobdellota archaeon]